jgi:murein DD-endopeptidase
MSTGPHLHYEVLMGSQQVNPSGIKFKTGTTLKGTELANFKKSMEKIEAVLTNLPKGGVMKLAMAFPASGEVRSPQ